jgi:hypothetical protein
VRDNTSSQLKKNLSARRLARQCRKDGTLKQSGHDKGAACTAVMTVQGARGFSGRTAR